MVLQFTPPSFRYWEWEKLLVLRQTGSFPHSQPNQQQHHASKHRPVNTFRAAISVIRNVSGPKPSPPERFTGRRQATPSLCVLVAPAICSPQSPKLGR